MSHPYPHDREEAQRWAQALLSHSDWVILDTETTGLDGKAVVVEIAVLTPEGNTLLDTLVRPKGPIPAEATAIHGISDAMVASAPTFPAVYAELISSLQGRSVVCYNAAYDQRILRQTARAHQLDEVPVRWHCAMEQYARFVGRWSDYHGRYTWPKLPPGRRFPEAGHRAIYDCWATLELIHAMADRPCFCGQ